VTEDLTYRVEVIADDSGQWCGNGLRFTSRVEATDYARSLSSRWMLVRAASVVGVDGTVLHVDGREVDRDVVVDYRGCSNG